MNKALLLLALPVAMAYAASSYAGKEEKVEWSRAPLAVQKTITENARGGKIDEIEKETETQNGKTITVYEADARKPDGNKFENKAPRRKQRGINCALKIRWPSASLRPKGRGIKPAEIKVAEDGKLIKIDD